jgi:hypothetical protein
VEILVKAIAENRRVTLFDGIHELGFVVDIENRRELSGEALVQPILTGHRGANCDTPPESPERRNDISLRRRRELSAQNGAAKLFELIRLQPVQKGRAVDIESPSQIVEHLGLNDKSVWDVETFAD